MSGSYRGVIFAFGLILCGAQPPKEQQHGTTRTQQSSNPPAPSYAPYPGYNPDPCYQSQDHDAADLCAQWRASIAAEKAAHETRRSTNWSIVATFLSFIAVIGLIVTIRQTYGALGEARRGNRLNLMQERRSRREGREAAASQERALQIAEKNADAAERAVSETQRIGEAQVRCYLNVSKCYMSYKGHQWLIGCKVENTGRSPAIMAEWEPTLVTYIIDKGGIRYSVATTLGGTLHYDIPVSGERDLAARIIEEPLNENEIQRLSGGLEVFFQLTAKVKCLDVFDRQVEHEAIFLLTLNSIPDIDQFFDLTRGTKVVIAT
jgi:hypothetical protein